MIFLGLLSIGLAVSTVRMRNERARVAQEVQERKNMKLRVSSRKSAH